MTIKHILESLTPIFFSFLFRPPSVIANVTVVTDVQVVPILVAGGTTGVVVIKKHQPMQLLSNDSISLGAPITITTIPPLIVSLDSASYDRTMDNLITLSGYNFQINPAATIGPINVSSTDLAITDLTAFTTATLQYYANQITDAGIYNIIWTNPDGGVGMIQVVFT